jgi:hypothetical protein
MNVTVTQTLCSAHSMTWQIRRNAGTPSIQGTTRFPQRVGYVPVATNITA